ncbi:hypothetical protein ASPBRDRAFT_484225 [Aspergillus brasiliensis CBS 101740]|uniref:Heterokaryon incompatibility domain-containing protein n=1 Tax=Aspergillus brasiliensis (strain CBS 101740 / IMI 381727 / IBT 21946) TaxID=767769 RepID=A0A1L9UUH6_ASPBC|nr:hypothetical protein ASPBRDRAFT_484225 [Aspergillus brasiliensis CBS 101740]
MSRWHDASCRRPDVSAAGGIPYCNYCFSSAIVEQDTRLAASPLALTKFHHDALWPSCLSSGGLSIPGDSANHGDSESQTDSKGSSFPELPSKNHLRLARLKAGPIDGLLHVELEVMHIHNQPAQSFEVLSYTSVNKKEDSYGSHIVFLGEYWDIVHVSSDCEQALRYIRSQKRDRLLWVDSLCIDPANLKEKGQQASLRGKMCQKASKVVAYLGGETPDSKEALEFLKSIATSGPGARNGQEHIDKETRRALRNLLKRPLFSRTWFLVEALLSRTLELVCGAQSAPWPKAPFALTHEDVPVPDWLFRNERWYGLTDRDLLPILVQASSYECSDPRDKVFAVLGLISQSELYPDYTVSVESIYTGLTTYLIKICSTTEVLELAGSRRKNFDIPSWVPDWSQALSTSGTAISAGDEDLDWKDDEVTGLGHVVFNNCLPFDCECHISGERPILRTRSIKVCRLRGIIKRVRSYVHISMTLGRKATIFVSFLDQGYEQGQDSLFLLGGYDKPVILREDSASGSYLFVSTCALSLGPPPSSRWSMPWISGKMTEPITIFGLSPEEKSLIREFNLLMEQAIRQFVTLNDDETSTSFSSVRDSVFSLSLYLQSPLPKHERRLWNAWEKFNSEVGWMFRDQQATWKFLQEVNNLNATERQGRGQIKLDRFDDVLTTMYCGVKLPFTYAWDLSRFVWSFLRRLDPEDAVQDPHWTPVLDNMIESLPKIRQWAETTEQLLKMCEYTQNVFGAHWASFPGNQLPQRWLGNYENFYRTVETDINQNISESRPSLDLSCHWCTREFENNARARHSLWNLKLPSELESKSASNLAVHAGFRSLGLELYDEQMVDIL